MVTSENCRTITPPYNSLLPYLRAKEAEKTVQAKTTQAKAEKASEDAYKRARREILRDE